MSGNTPYVRFDRNDYSIPHTHVRTPLTLVASASTVRVLDGETLLATHPRSFSAGEQLEHTPHIEELTKALERAATVEEAAKVIAQAYVETASATAGTRLQALVRGKPVSMEVTAMPFVPSRYYRG